MDTCSGADRRQPLVRLFNRAEAVFIADFDRRIAASEFAGLSLAHSRNVLRQLGEGPRRASQVAGSCDVTKQALSQQIAQLERDGYLSVAPDPHDARARILTLTDKGERAQALAHRIFAEIEDDWSAEIGEDELATVRRVLTALVEAAGVRDGRGGPARVGC